MLLNFGHTLAHAVEVLMGYEKVLHGEAVAMGMVAAARRSEALGFLSAGDGGAHRIPRGALRAAHRAAVVFAKCLYLGAACR